MLQEVDEISEDSHNLEMMFRDENLLQTLIENIKVAVTTVRIVATMSLCSNIC